MVVESIIPRLYERMLLRSIGPEQTSKSILIVIVEDDLLSSEGLDKLVSFVEWSLDLGIEIVNMYVDLIDDAEIAEMICPKLSKDILRVLSDVKADIFIRSRHGTDIRECKDSTMSINISIGLGGRAELTEAFSNIMKIIESGSIEPEDIDSELIESNLIFKSEPDLIIRSGGRLTDFLIWQSIYSELYFTEVNWQNFRKIDLLRAIREYQSRQRRFGK
ncbi:MAG: undecaprenyl diphosphate synthase family protein [Halobacteriota archaeon]|nr:undecaprenyl diphosphate synthase family protein [Halobacteriota archaeon]